MSIRSVAALALVFLPALAAAQGRPGGPGGPGGRPSGPGGGRGGRPPMLTAKDLESHDPVAVLLKARKALALSADQVSALEALRAKLAPDRAVLIARFDSVRQQMRAPGGGFGSMTDADREQMRAGREKMTSALEALREHDTSATTAALALLGDALREPATKLLDEDREELEQRMRPRGGPDGGRRRPPGGGAPPV